MHRRARIKPTPAGATLAEGILTAPEGPRAPQGRWAGGQVPRCLGHLAPETQILWQDLVSVQSYRLKSDA